MILPVVLDSSYGEFGADWSNDDKATGEIAGNPHHAAGIIELIAVLRRGEYRHAAPHPEKLVAVLNDLVRSRKQVEIELFQKLPQL